MQTVSIYPKACGKYADECARRAAWADPQHYGRTTQPQQLTVAPEFLMALASMSRADLIRSVVSSVPALVDRREE